MAGFDYYGGSYRDGVQGCGQLVGLVFGLVVLALVMHGCISMTWVSDDAAMERIEELFPADTEVEIIRDSGNDNFLFHDYDDVDFELEVTYPDGNTERSRVNCSKQMFADMVCGVWNTGQ